MAWKVTYYNEGVMEEVRGWPEKMRGKYLHTVDLIEAYGAQLGKAFTKPLRSGLFEIRIKAKEGIGRALFCYQLKHEIVVLHAFRKKTQRTPRKELNIAITRMKQVKNEKNTA